MRAKHVHEPELKLRVFISKSSISVEGLRILARIIARHSERKRQQFKLNAIDENVNGNEPKHKKEQLLWGKKKSGNG